MQRNAPLTLLIDIHTSLVNIAGDVWMLTSNVWMSTPNHLNNVNPKENQIP